MTTVSVCLIILASLSAQGDSGSTIHVSKLGDNSDGSSWAKAYTTIQGALNAVPDDQGKHRIVVRPDTYMEANLFPAHKGAAGAYNELIGDYDGSLGSGTKGWVVIDSGDAEKGFKSYDWWSTIKAYKQGWSKEHTDATFSSIGWDRWRLSRIYSTGADAGLFWDCTDNIEPFTVVVEDCVGIGRAFGGGVGSCLSRTEEPIVFRRCHLWALDWWGDTAAAYVRIENKEMPDRPDVYFEDCVMTSPQCSLKGGNFGFHTYMRINVNRCKLITLNFSQPAGTPTDGIIQSVEQGKYLHVDLEDTTLMGYKVFGVRVNKETANEIGYSAKGSVLAYVQFQQEVPKGIHRLGSWPVDVFQDLMPPIPENPRPKMEEKTLVKRDMCEVSPVIWQGRPCLMECVRPASGGTAKDYYLVLHDGDNGAELARFAEGYSLACAFVHDNTLYAFAARFEDNNWNDVTLFKSVDLKSWEHKVVIRQDEKEHLFNSSVCEGPNGFVMAYETNDPAYPAFTIKFAESTDLDTWTKRSDAIFGTDRYTACPCIRYANGQYYLMYLEHRTPRWFFEEYIARSTNLVSWELSMRNPILTVEDIKEGINASDVDVVEFGGKSHIYYAVGDQLTWMNIQRITYPGPLAEYLERWF